jgi:hypothetical protein
MANVNYISILATESRSAQRNSATAKTGLAAEFGEGPESSLDAHVITIKQLLLLHIWRHMGAIFHHRKAAL